MKKRVIICLILLVAVSFFVVGDAFIFKNSQDLISTKGIIGNTNITSSDKDGYDYQSLNNFYKVYFRNNSNEGGTIDSASVRFEKEGYTFTYDISGGQMLWRTTSTQPVASSSLGGICSSNSLDTQVEISGSEAKYENAFCNTTMIYEVKENMLKETFILHGLPSIKDYLYLEYSGNIKFNKSLKICTEEKCFTPSGTQDDFNTSGRIYFKDEDNKTIFYLKEPVITDSAGKEILGEYFVKGSDAQMNFDLRINTTFLKNAVYPVYIDPTILAGAYVNTSLYGAQSIIAVGDYLYIAALEANALVTLNIAGANAANPSQTGYYSDALMTYQPMSVSNSGDYLYVTSIGGTLTTFNIAGPNAANPLLTGFFYNASSLSYPLSGDASGGYLYVTSHYTNSIVIFNISGTNATKPEQVGFYNGSSIYGPMSSEISGDYLYVTSLIGLTTFNISGTNATKPDVVGYYSNITSLNYPIVLHNAGDYLYATSLLGNLFTTFNKTGDQASNPSQTGFFYNASSIYGPYAITSSGGYLYISSFTGNALITFNITGDSVSNPTQIGYSYGLIGSRAMTTSGIYLYATSYYGSSVSVYTLYVNLIPPTISIVSPLNNSYSSDGSLNISYVATAGNGLASCKYTNDTNSINTTLASCGTNISGVNWVDGIHNLTIWAEDIFENENYNVIFFNIDTINPNVTIDSLITLAPLSVTVNSTADDINLANCSYSIYNSSGDVNGLNRNISFTCNSSFTATTTEYGFFNTTISVYDKAGNVNYSSRTYNISAATPAGGGSSENVVETIIINKSHCGDLICQSPNDYGQYEDYWNCQQDCPGAVGENLDKLVFGLWKYCLDKDEGTICLWKQGLFSAMPIADGVDSTCGDKICSGKENLVNCKTDCGKLNLDTLAKNCFDDASLNSPCFFDTNIGALTIFGVVILTFVSVFAIKTNETKIRRYFKFKKRRKRR